MKVLFAIRDGKNIIATIENKYKQDYGKKITCKEVKDFTAITKELQKNNDYDKIIIDDECEKITNQVKESLIKKICKLSDSKKIIYIVDNKEKVPSIFNLGIYNIVIGNEKIKRNVYNFVVKANTKKQAMDTYNIKEENKKEVKAVTAKKTLPKKEATSMTNKPKAEVKEEKISTVELFKNIKYLNRNDLDEEKYIKRFNNLYSKLDEDSLNILIQSLDSSTKKILKKGSKKYSEFLESGKKSNQEEKNAGVKRRGRPRKVQAEEEVSSETIQEKKKRGRPRKVEVEDVAKNEENKSVKEKKSTETAKETKKTPKKETTKVSNQSKKSPVKVDKKEKASKEELDLDNFDLEDEKVVVAPKKKNKKSTKKPEKVEDEELDLEDLDVYDDDLNLDDKELEDLDLDNEEFDLDDEDDLDLDDEVLDEEDLDLEDEELDDDDLDLEDEELDEDNLDLEDEELDDDDIDLEDEELDDDDLDLEDEELDEDDIDLDDEELDEDESEIDTLNADTEESQDEDLNLDDDILGLVQDDDVDTTDEEDDSDDIINLDDLDFSEEDSGDDTMQNNTADEDDDDILNLDDDDDNGIINFDEDEDDEDDSFNLDDDDDIVTATEDDTDNDESADVLDVDTNNNNEDDDILELDDDSNDDEDDDLITLDDDSDDDGLISLDDDEDAVLKLDDDNDSANELFSGIRNKNYNPNYDLSKQISAINDSEDLSNEVANVAHNINLSDDKKVVAFVGGHGNGTSFIVNNLANLLSGQGIKVAILDLTKNKNSYYIYTENEESLRSIAFSCFDKLKSGIPDGIKTNKNLTVYTSLPNSGNEIEDIDAAINTILSDNTLVLLDCDIDTDKEFFAIAQEIYLVQSLDILTIQPLTSLLKRLKMDKVLDETKIRILINKDIRVNDLNDRILISAMSVYNSPDTTYQLDLFNRDTVQYLTIPFEERNYSKYLGELAKCKLKISGYSKALISSFNKLAKMVYPIGKKKK